MRRLLATAIAVTAGLAAPVCAGAQESAVQLRTNAGTLHGTLLLPASAEAPVPVALIIAGSGPTDRDGNTPMLPGRNNSLRMVAEALASAGVASVRYDKRGIGASAAAFGSESDLRFTTFVDDAAAWIDTLSTDSRFSRVIVVGHSEGSLIGIMAAHRGGGGGRVARVVSLAGAGRSAMDVLEEQLSRNLGGSGPLLDDARRIMAELRNGRLVDTVPPPLAALFRKSVQPYLMSWLGIDPAAEAGKLGVPLLVVQGTTDIQVGVVDAERLAAGNPAARLEIIDGMNHVLKEVREPGRQAASYSDSTLTLHPRLIDVLASFAARQ